MSKRAIARPRLCLAVDTRRGYGGLSVLLR
jgi:hypothetical protein